MLMCAAELRSNSSRQGRRPRPRHHARRDHRDGSGGRLRSACAGGAGRGAVPAAAHARQQTGEEHVNGSQVRFTAEEALGTRTSSLHAMQRACGQAGSPILQTAFACAWISGSNTCDTVPGRSPVTATARAQATTWSWVSASPASCRAASTAPPWSRPCGSTAASTSTGALHRVIPSCTKCMLPCALARAQLSKAADLAKGDSSR